MDSLEYSFKYKTGRLYLRRGRRPDMDGCIRLFTAIDPNVEMIRTLSGFKWGPVYKRHGDCWEARPAGRVTYGS
jgi:hypothetical protein